MKDLIDQLEEAIDKARLACAANKAETGKDIGYHFGSLQGMHSGLNQALKIVTNFLEEIGEEKD